MLPMKAPRTPRTVQAFELITPAGRIYQFPRPAWLQRIALLFYSFGEPIVLAAIVLALVYCTGILADALESLPTNTCPDQIRT
jgi:hypothetical protein